MSDIGILPWIKIVAMFVVPLALGLVCFRIASRFHKEWARLLTRLFGAGMFMLFLIFVVVGMPYLWALHLEPKWTEAEPKTLAELESHLSLYSRHEIDISQPSWRHFPLKPGERLVEYWLLYSAGAPLDVVCTTNETIVKIYTAYE